ncbi:ABC transporter substrate-binding protein [Williamsia sp. CHRR-6]|uniref:ABC transporter substrate-binding protein n=1 Tax=Williamsia sp. CHRR-6 TaxID=2835871 RepID=UPI001BDB0E79|nr:ABC transporter substrate-binding protein [Williamsia sp. CHRR-6]MBT0565866.1 ABC transporter substrate-binding protein [Williamsia sp. CHRR-6]
MNISRTLAVAATAVAVIATAGCNANSNSSGGSSTSFVKGGTLTIPVSSTELDLDPAKSQNLAITTQSLINRRLTTWQAVPGKPVVPVPDLATDTGTPSNGGATWKYTLKPGLKFSDGTPITSKDVKYAVERSFAPLLSGGFTYHKQLLVGGADYTGPYDGKQLDSIATPDDSTIIFTLKQPFGDWPWIVSQPAFAPVPKAKDNPQTYGKSPVASGPYQVVSNGNGKIVLDRNPNWSAATDSNRTAGPDRIEFALGVTAETAVQQVISDSTVGRFSFGGPVPSSQVAALNANANAKKRSVTVGGGSVDQVAINTSRGALRDLRVRQALNYATDKTSYLVASGGSARGTVATTNIPPAIPGFTTFDALPAAPTGDVDKAKALLAQAGFPNGIDLVLVTQNGAQQVAQSESLQAGWKRAGIRVKLRPLDSTAYEDVTTQQDGSGYDLALAKWQADFPSAYSMLQPLFAGTEVGRGGYNISRLSDPTVDAAIAKATAEVDTARANVLWGEADKLITGLSPTIPLANTNNTWVYGSRVSNFYAPPFPSYPNYFRISLQP